MIDTKSFDEALAEVRRREASTIELALHIGISAYLASWNRRDEQAEVVGHTANCCNCGRIIDTREVSDGGDRFGHQLDDDLWVCSRECYDSVVPPVASTPAVAAGGVTEERVEALARKIDPMIFGPNYTGRTKDIARAALTASLAVGDEGIREGWQPISTAPKDGTEIQVFVRTDEGAEMQQVAHWDGAPTAEWPWQVSDGSAYHRDLFTHWQPLPTPPSRGEGV